MSRPNWNLLRSLLARAAREPHGEAVADAELLRRYGATRDAAAFELLVRRYADLVFGVCRRVCRDEHDAQDAFQATFLILARKAGSVRKNLAGWLHRTANRVAIRASHRMSRIRDREMPLSEELIAPTATELAELRAVLDAEIDRLPERLRLAVLLCYVDGCTTTEAAERLSVPHGTILSRLAKARDLLSARLTRRGVTAPLTGAALAAALGGETASATLVATATSTVLIPVAGSAVELLSLEVLRMAAWKTTTAWAAALMLTAGLGTGTGIMMAQGEKPGAATATQPGPGTAKTDDPKQIATNNEEKVNLRNLKIQLEKMQYAQTQYSEKKKIIRNQINAMIMSTTGVHESKENLENHLTWLREYTAKLAKDIFIGDEQILELELTRTQAIRDSQQFQRNKPSDEKVDEQIQALAEYQNLKKQQNDYLVLLKDYESKMPATGPSAKLDTLKHSYDKITKDIESLKNALRPRIEQNIIAKELEPQKKALQEIESRLELQKSLNEMRKKRLKEMRKQYNELNSIYVSIEPLEADYKLCCRGEDILNQRLAILQLELGGIIIAPESVSNADVMREIAELRAEVRKLADAKK